MRKVIFIPLLLCLFLLPQLVKAESVNLTLYLPPDNYGVPVNTTVVINSTVVSDTNGSMYMYWDIYKFYCGEYYDWLYPSILNCALQVNPENVTAGTHYWWASFNTSSTTYNTSKRTVNGVYTSFSIVPVSPINNATVIGDNTNFTVNYTVRVYLPYKLGSPRYIHFFDYVTYLGTPTYSSERLVCTFEIPEETDIGFHDFSCVNPMYEPITGAGYHEYPSYRFWRAKLRVLDQNVDGANLLGDTGYSDYTYVILTTLTNVHPKNMTVLGDELFLRLREMQGGTPAWYLLYDPFNFINVRTDDTFTFYGYTRNPCVGNLTFTLKNILNTSYTIYVAINNTPVVTIGDYFFVIWNPDENQTGMRIDNETVLVNYTYYWSFYCNNGTSYGSPTYFIYNYAYQPVAPTPFNVSAPYYTFINATGEYFNVEIGIALMFMAGIWMVVITFFVAKKGGSIAGGIAGILSLLVFTRIGWLPLWIGVMMLIGAGFVVVMIIRKIFLGK